MLALGNEEECRFLALSLSPLRLSNCPLLILTIQTQVILSRQTVDLVPIHAPPWCWDLTRVKFQFPVLHKWKCGAMWRQVALKRRYVELCSDIE